MLLAIDDLRDFDAHLRVRSAQARARLRERAPGHRLTLREARVHHVLMPMVGLYTPGWQALPAWSWGFVELVTNEGPVGTGEWSVAVDEPARAAVERLRATPCGEPPRRRVGDPALHGLVGSGRPDARQATARALGRALRGGLRAARRACRWPRTRGSGSPMPRAATP